MSQLMGKTKRHKAASQEEIMALAVKEKDDTIREMDAHENALRTHEKENEFKRKGICLEPSQAEEVDGQIEKSLPGMNSLSLTVLPEQDGAYVPINYSTTDQPFECKLSFQKGLGLFATRPIAAGHIILRESPLLCCSDHVLEKEASYLALSENNKSILSGLQSSCHCSTKGRFIFNCQESSIKHIWATNAFSMPSALNDYRFEEAGMPLTGIYALASRLNHSCDPNASYGFTSNGELRVWAKRDIGQGEEIMRSYLSVYGMESFPIRGLRWQKMGFQCTCTICLTFPDLPMATAEMVANHTYYHAVGRILADSPDAANCPLVEFVSKEEMERFQKSEEWAAGMQEDLMRRFEEFKLGSAVCMVVRGMPPSIVITAMLMELRDRDWTQWAGLHLEHVLKTGPELSHTVLASYMARLPEYLTRKKHAVLREVFMGVLPDLARYLKDYKVPKIQEGGIDKARLVDDLKRILAITLTEGESWVSCEGLKEIEYIEELRKSCGHPDCMEHVEEKIEHGMI